LRGNNRSAATEKPKLPKAASSVDWREEEVLHGIKN
jgi:hypothetical protein